MPPDTGSSTTVLPVPGHRSVLSTTDLRVAQTAGPSELVHNKGPSELVRGVLPAHRVVILGAGRNIHGTVPTAIVDIDRGRCVLDWLLEAFSALQDADIEFISGYQASAVAGRYPDIRLIFNPDWATTGPAKSLSLAHLWSATATYVSYADVVFRPQIVRRMEHVQADVVIAVDGNWKYRYDARSHSELEGAEKVRSQGDQFLDIGKHIPMADASAEFAGLIRLSADMAKRLQNVIGSGVFEPSDGLPEIIRFLVRNGVSIAMVDVNGGWAELNAPQDLARFVLGTKAESLDRLKPLVRTAHIGEQVCLTHRQWSKNRDKIIQRILEAFPGGRLIVRSSALSEDTWQYSCAGAHESILDVPACDIVSLTEAVETVFGSYSQVQPGDQVLVQEMLEQVRMSGVVMTRTPTLGAAYYVINYDNTTSQTDTVTAGNAGSLRTLFLHRQARLRPDSPQELQHLLTAIQEIEQLVRHDSLDIEFAVTADGRVHILQVRPIAVAHLDTPIDDAQLANGLADAIRFLGELNRPSPFLLGESTQLSVMSDWNPAEIIGTKPNRLAFSLYRYLITDELWARQRAEYGYRDVRPCNLLVDILGHPYIDIRATFNSFVPASLPQDLAARLVGYYMDRLRQNPELHDKVEFDVLLTCLTFDFDRRSQGLCQVGFSKQDIEQLRVSLRKITRQGIARCAKDLADLAVAQRRFDCIRAGHVEPLTRVFLLLDDARAHSIIEFAHLARNAFVATSLLRSLGAVGILTEQQIEAFLASVRTVSSQMQFDARSVARDQMSWEAFVDKYGHLRPGTYDIGSPSYAGAPEEYLKPVVDAAADESQKDLANYSWDASTREAINDALVAIDLGIDVDAFEKFCRQAIEGREFSKFVFTRNLSAALEALAEFGANHFISREELSHIRIQDLLALRSGRAESTWRTLKELSRIGRETSYVTQAACLPGQIFDSQDLVCFEQLKAVPNFVTCKQVRAQVVCLSAGQSPTTDLTDKIVVTPNADPGFDWIFSRRIAGLLTMYGGANSHMAVRAAEFQLPAATGIGELLYSEVSKAEFIELDCKSRRIQVLR